jgi:hypothetical protein
MVKAVIALGVLLLATSAVASETSYLCVTDLATGFSFDKTTSSWKVANFAPRGKYLVSRSSGKGYAWEVKAVGDKEPQATCKKDFSEFGTLVCEGFTELRMNRNSGRFLAIYAIGYWSDDKNLLDGILREGANTPNMEIGKCSPL